MTTKQTETNDTPKRRYFTGYLIMLILGTINVLTNLVGFVEIPSYFSKLSTDPLLSILLLLYPIATLITIAALVFLFQKKKLGIRLMLGSYAFTFVLTILSLFAVEHMVASALASATTEQISALGGRSSFIDTTRVIYYFTYGVGVIVIPAFAALWHYVWQRQAAIDKS